MDVGSQLIERHLENAVQEILDDKAIRALKRIGEIAAKQGGETPIENYKLLGKRALIAVGAAILVAEVATSAVAYVVSSKLEEQRIEKVVRRILEEERQNQ